MSDTYNIVCFDCKKSLWVGQIICGDEEVDNHVFYTGEPKTIQALGRFLFTHRGHHLSYLEEQEIPEDDKLEREEVED
jgi:hypothetical protein